MAKTKLIEADSDSIELHSVTTNNPVTVGHKNSTHWTDCDKKGSNTAPGLKLYYSKALSGVMFKQADKVLFVVPTANIPQYVPKDLT
jgi:hypothetical protein